MTITMTITTTSPKKRTSRQARKLKICVWTHLGLIKWKTISTKQKNQRRHQTKNRRRPQQKNGRQPQQKKLKWKTTPKFNLIFLN